MACPELNAVQGNSFVISLVDSRVLRNIRLQTPSGPEGSSGSNPLCVPQGCLAINKLFMKNIADFKFQILNLEHPSKHG